MKWTQNTATALVYTNMGWLGDGSHRGQGCQAWTAAGIQTDRTTIPILHCSHAHTIEIVPIIKHTTHLDLIYFKECFCQCNQVFKQITILFVLHRLDTISIAADTSSIQRPTQQYIISALSIAVSSSYVWMFSQSCLPVSAISSSCLGTAFLPHLLLHLFNVCSLHLQASKTIQSDISIWLTM